ncbi:Uncharacterized protein SCF082_LOCUS42245, partial [Durusdinium trenchii]
MMMQPLSWARAARPKRKSPEFLARKLSSLSETSSWKSVAPSCSAAAPKSTRKAQSRSGPVTVHEDYNDGDLTMLRVPQEAVGFVTGRAGNFLRTIEEEWGTLMFFVEVESSRSRSKEYEKLAIFGDVRARRGAELKVLSAVETKVPGYFDKIRDDVIPRDKGTDYEDGSWGTDTMQFQDDELSYALGKQGGTRKKIERSSGAIVQYVGQ